MNPPYLEPQVDVQANAEGFVRVGKRVMKAAGVCLEQAFYHLRGYPTDDSDEFMKLLGEGGHVVGELARLQFPDGIMVGDRRPKDAVQTTKTLIDKARKAGETIVLFEPAFDFVDEKKFGRTVFYFRPDILIVKPEGFEIIEVKSKSATGEKKKKDGELVSEGEFDSSGVTDLESFFYQAKKPNELLSSWEPYAIDAVYQHWVLKNIYPKDRVEVSLMLPDKAKTVATDGLPAMFEFVEDETGWPEVIFRGDPAVVRDPKNQILTQFKLNRVLETVTPKIEALALKVAGLVNELGQVAEPANEIGVSKCKHCPFTATSKRFGVSGFDRCYEKIFSAAGIASADDLKFIHHLYKVTMLNEARGATRGEIGKVADKLMREGKARVTDVKIPDTAKNWAPGQEGFDNFRRWVQIEAARTGQEILMKERMAQRIKSWKLPWVMIDFETARFVIPPVACMRPYETVAFQWSVHRWDDPTQKAVHADHLDFENPFPNFVFARKLMETVDTQGTFFMWSHHEVTTLKEILRQAQRAQLQDAELVNWLIWVTSKEGPFVDLDEVTKQDFCHPLMGGRTSIKKTMPAVVASTPSLKKHPAFKELLKGRAAGEGDLYASLPEIDVGGKPFKLAEGTAAIKAYQLAMFSKFRKDPVVQKKLYKGLKIYCGLDTNAMLLFVGGMMQRQDWDLPLFAAGEVGLSH